MNLTSSLATSDATSDVVEASVNYATVATGAFSWMWLLLAFPLFGVIVLLLGGRRTNSWGHWLGVAMVVASFATAVVMFFTMVSRPETDRSATLHLWDWIIVGSFEVPISLHLDQLSMTFVLLITGVGSLIHIYAVGYMQHDPDRRKFFGYLNLFIAAMLLLVMADNYLLLYFGWEGVGLASFLLISFWQFKPSAAVAGKKAFVVNRVGDIGMSIAIMLIFVTFGSVTFEGVLPNVGQVDESTMTWIGLALLLAACGKSAQFPLQSWLLDAMEGPTPVSALIHAATMVTAGVYLIVRSGPIFESSPTAQNAVIIIGCITLIFGAIIGCAKDDIKKVLAGSTMSQIGYMVLAAGLGPIGYVFAIFHLVAHGCFKANMFLGAGSIMHGMNNQVDMRRFGALRLVMAATFVTFSCGWLAIMGIPPFAGFFSKDKIIEVAFVQGWIPGMAAAIGAVITAFYMTRLWTMTFTGKARWTEDNQHPHESPKIMIIPIAVLAFLSVTIGFTLAYGNAIINWLSPVTGYAEGETVINHYLIEFGTLALVIVGALVAYMQYRREVPITPPAHVSPLTVAARRDLYGDAFNEAVFMRPGQKLTRSLLFFDTKAIDGAVNGLAATTGGLSGRIRRIQNGYVRSYGLMMFFGVVVILGLLILVRT